jgi:hypothetical protein
MKKQIKTPQVIDMSVVKLDPKTQLQLKQLMTEQVELQRKINDKLQTMKLICKIFLNSRGAEGKYDLSADCKQLVRTTR